MKKLLLLLLPLLLMGCSAPDDFETMSDNYYIPQPVKADTVTFAVPEDAALTVMENGEFGSIYLCDGYAITVQTVPAGNLDWTIRQITGYPKDKLQIIQRDFEGKTRYSCVWAAAGEGGDQVGRAEILDDGDYHYILSVMGDAESAGAQTEVWQEIFDTFNIVP